MGQVTKKQNTNVADITASYDLLDQTSNEGKNYTIEDLAIPFIGVLQQLSPQVDESDAQYIEGAKAGMIFNNVTEEIWDGQKGILVIPVAYKKSYTEWVPRDQGGGLVADHGSNKDILNKATVDSNNRRVLQNGNIIQDANHHYVFLLKDDGSFQEALIAMTSTQLKKSKRWNTMISTLSIVDEDNNRSIRPPSYFRTYRLTSVKEENEKGKWHGWRITPEQNLFDPKDGVNIIPNGFNIFKAAQDFNKRVQAGDVKVNQEMSSTIVEDISDTF